MASMVWGQDGGWGNREALFTDARIRGWEWGNELIGKAYFISVVRHPSASFRGFAGPCCSSLAAHVDALLAATAGTSGGRAPHVDGSSTGARASHGTRRRSFRSGARRNAHVDGGLAAVAAAGLSCKNGGIGLLTV